MTAGRRRCASILLTAVLAAQAFVGAEAAFAASADPSASAPAGHCGGGATHDPGQCPCCPDGATMAGCLYLCAAHAVTAAPRAQAPISAAYAAIAFVSHPKPLQSYPPPDPPPIA